MLSMVEKINRYAIKECERQLADMVGELKGNIIEFGNNNNIQSFEKDWIELYL